MKPNNIKMDSSGLPDETYSIVASFCSLETLAALRGISAKMKQNCDKELKLRNSCGLQRITNKKTKALEVKFSDTFESSGTKLSLEWNSRYTDFDKLIKFACDSCGGYAPFDKEAAAHQLRDNLENHKSHAEEVTPPHSGDYYDTKWDIEIYCNHADHFMAQCTFMRGAVSLFSFKDQDLVKSLLMCAEPESLLYSRIHTFSEKIPGNACGLTRTIDVLAFRTAGQEIQLEKWYKEQWD